MSEQEPKATGTKFSQFAATTDGPIEVVGLKDGSNVRATLTTDLIETNPDVTFRNAKGQFRSVKDLEELTNQLKVNRFLANEVELLNEAVANLAAGSVVVSDDAPNIEADGQLWYDSNRLELFVSYQDAWISTSPLESRIEAGEALQAEILGRVEAGEAKQTTIESEYLNKKGGTANKMKGNLYLGGFFIAGLGEPTAGNHAATMQYVDNQVASIKQSGALDPYASNFIMPGYGLTGAGDSVGGEGVFKFVRMDGEGFTANPKDSRGICFDIRKYSSFFADLRTKLDVGTCYGTGIIYVWDETVSEETGLIAKYRVMNRGDYDTQGGGSFLIYGDQLMARSAASTTHTYRIELVGF